MGKRGKRQGGRRRGARFRLGFQEDKLQEVFALVTVVYA